MDKNSDASKIENITSSSTKEEISNFLGSKFKISKEIQTKMIEEDISGDILLNVEESELKKLGFKIGPIKKVKKFLSDNKSYFPEIKLEAKIDKSSNVEEVKTFFENCLNFKGDINLDGTKLLELNKDDILKMGLNLGQRKKLEKYIKYFKDIQSKKEEEKINKEDQKSSEKKMNEEEKGKLKDNENSEEKNKNEKPPNISENKDNKNDKGQSQEKEEIKKEEIIDDKKEEIKIDKDGDKNEDKKAQKKEEKKEENNEDIKEQKKEEKKEEKK